MVPLTPSVVRQGLVPLLFVASQVVSAAASPEAPLVAEASADQVEDCKPVGQVVGESPFCSKTLGKKSALKQAEALGGTHVVWLQFRCVPFVGEKVTARVFNCASTVSLGKDFEDYLEADSRLALSTIRFEGVPRIMSSGDLDADSSDLARRGYVLVGYAGVSGGRVPLETVRKKAVAVGAEITLFRSSAAGADIEYQAVTTYNRGGAGIAHSFGAIGGAVGGSQVGVSGTGTSIMSAPGNTQTEMVPFSQRRFDTQVLFFRKLKAAPLGIFVALIPTDLRARLARNTGAFVVGVEDEGPAFFANVVPGDIIIAVNGIEVRTPTEYASTVENLGPASVTLQILRGGASLEVKVQEGALDGSK
jgi:serine protease Do